MKKILLIRHAESEANLGKELFPHDNIIKITEKGKQQAENLAEILDEPKRIFVSKLIRTQETAEPTIKKFPDSEVHLWMDTDEFDPCGHAKIGEMSEPEQLKEFNWKYWERLDPDFKDNQHVESFRELVDRVDSVILKLKKIPDGVNYIFTHGWFIKAFYVMVNDFSNFDKIKTEEGVYKKIMEKFCEFDRGWKTRNTGVYDVTSLVEKYCK